MLKNLNIEKVGREFVLKFVGKEIPEIVLKHIFRNHYLYRRCSGYMYCNHKGEIMKSIEDAFSYAKSFGHECAHIDIPVYSMGEIVIEEVWIPRYLRPLMTGYNRFNSMEEIKEWLLTVPALLEGLASIYADMEMLAVGFEESMEADKDALKQFTTNCQEMMDSIELVSITATKNI